MANLPPVPELNKLYLSRTMACKVCGAPMELDVQLYLLQLVTLPIIKEVEHRCPACGTRYRHRLRMDLELLTYTQKED